MFSTNKSEPRHASKSHETIPLYRYSTCSLSTQDLSTVEKFPPYPDKILSYFLTFYSRPKLACHSFNRKTMMYLPISTACHCPGMNMHSYPVVLSATGLCGVKLFLYRPRATADLLAKLFTFSSLPPLPPLDPPSPPPLHPQPLLPPPPSPILPRHPVFALLLYTLHTSQGCTV